jgi:hypothetical protein
MSLSSFLEKKRAGTASEAKLDLPRFGRNRYTC